MAEGGSGLIPDNEIRIILLGKTGAGKSRTGNSILGSRNAFNFEEIGSSVTKTCCSKSVQRLGKNIRIVDTPGVFDTDQSNFDVQSEIKKSIALTTPGPNAVLLCIRIGRLTIEDIDTLKHYMQFFGEDLLKYVIVIFTHLDKYNEDQEDSLLRMTITDFIDNLPTFARNFLKKCGDRYLFFDNRKFGDENVFQVENLIKMINEMTQQNRGRCYTNDDYKRVEELRQLDITRKGHKRYGKSVDVRETEEFLERVIEILGRIAIKLLSDYAFK